MVSGFKVLPGTYWGMGQGFEGATMNNGTNPGNPVPPPWLSIRYDPKPLKALGTAPPQ